MCAAFTASRRDLFCGAYLPSWDVPTFPPETNFMIGNIQLVAESPARVSDVVERHKYVRIWG